MGAAVDTEAMLIRSGDVAFPFEVDCGDGAAVFDPGGAGIRVRVMSWGEKCGLARFAQCGAGFVERQFLLICAGTVLEAPRRDALAALVLWLHAPAAPPLPLDVPLLARASLDLCRALATAPGALAGRPAPEIEALWRALAEGSGTPVSPRDADNAGEVTRIIVLPDAARSEVAAEQRAPSPLEPGAVAEPRRAVLPTAPESDPPTAAISAIAAGAVPAIAPIAAAERMRPLARFAVRFGTGKLAPPSIAALKEFTPDPARPPDEMLAAPPRAGRRMAGPAKPPDGDPGLRWPAGLPPAPTGSPDISASMPNMPRDVGSTAMPVLASATGRQAPIASGGPDALAADASLARVVAAVSLSAARLEAEDPDSRADSLVDAFAERLADAAVDLGIRLTD